jgi:CRP-like cAMP-binding protein
VLLQVDRSVREGDWLRIDDITGRVTHIRWRHTAIENRNGETIIVPNGWMLKNRFTILASRSNPDLPWRRWIRLSVDLSAPPSAVCAVLEEAVTNARIPNVALDPKPSAVLMDFGAHQGFYALRYWINDRRPDDPTDSAVRTHILAALARHDMKVGVPYTEQLQVKDNEAHRKGEREHDLMQRVEALKHVELFASLSAAERESLADHLIYAPFATGDVITRQGAVAHWLYLMHSGRAEVWREAGTERLKIGTLEEGEVFGEMGMMTGAPRGATVTALTDVVCYRLDKGGFATVLMARPDIAESMSRVLAGRQSHNEELLRDSHLGEGRGAQPHEAILGRIREFFGLSASQEIVS